MSMVEEQAKSIIKDLDSIIYCDQPLYFNHDIIFARALKYIIENQKKEK